MELDNWPDYVFAADYPLQSLSEISRYIKSHGHLPGMPDAVKIQRDGLSLGEMVKLQQEKIEQLTLLLIAQERQLIRLSKRVDFRLKKNKHSKKLP